MKAVVFDLDGTLLDTIKDLAMATNYAITYYGYKSISIEDTKRYIGNGIRNLILRSIGNDLTHIDDLFLRFKEYYTLHCSDYTKPYAGIYDTLDKLKKDGYRLGCISNKQQYALDVLIDKHFKGYFDVVIGDGSGYKRKPDPEVIYEAAKRLNVSIDDFIYVGDSDVDVKTVENSSCKGIFVSYGFRDKEVLESLNAKVIVDSAYNIYNKVKEIEND